MTLITGVVFAETTALKNVRIAYRNQTAAIQIENLKNRFYATDDLPIRAQSYKKWHKHTQALLKDERDQYACQIHRCCVDLYWGRHFITSCFRV